MKRRVCVVLVAGFTLISVWLAGVGRAADSVEHLDMLGTGDLYTSSCSYSTTSCAGVFKPL